MDDMIIDGETITNDDDRRLGYSSPSSSSSLPSIREELRVEVLFRVSGSDPVVQTVPATRTIWKLRKNCKIIRKDSLLSVEPVSQFKPVFEFLRRNRTPVLYMDNVPKATIPSPMRDAIVRELSASGGEIRLLIQKKLFKSDLDKGLNRLAMPLNQILIPAGDFLTAEEEAALDRRRMNDGRGRRGGLEGIEVSFLEPCSLRVTKMELKKWKSESKTGGGSYMLIKNWFEVASKNGLKESHVIQVWFFRDARQNPCFALVDLNGNDPHHLRVSAACTTCNESIDSSDVTTD